jgi:hypothetical protein
LPRTFADDSSQNICTCRRSTNAIVIATYDKHDPSLER